jgi:hypothetical protein
MVLTVRLEVILQNVDVRGQQSDLNLGGTGVCGAELILLDDLRLFSC